MIRFIPLTFIFLLNCTLIAQNKSKIESLKKLGKDSLIKLAVKKIDDPSFNQKNYDRVHVKADSNRIWVEFELSIRFKSKGLCYYDAITVSLIGGGTSKSVTGFCDNPKYYKRNAKQLKKIDFVFNSINKKNEIGDIPNKKLGDDMVMDITEMRTYYHIEVSDGNTMSRYKIDKSSGKIYDAIHKNYMKDRDDPPHFETIQE